jgi:hypothetical protein
MEISHEFNPKTATIAKRSHSSNVNVAHKLYSLNHNAILKVSLAASSLVNNSEGLISKH